MNIQEFNKTVDFKSENKVEFCEEALFDNELTSPITSNDLKIKDKDIDELQLLVHEEVDIKNEDVEDDRLDSKMFNERKIKNEYFDVPELITREDIVIETEHQEEDPSSSKHFDPNHETSNETFICRYCHIGLSTKKYKNAHERRCKFRKMEQHLGGSVFECSYCKLLYTREEDKNRHQAVCKKRKESEKCEGYTKKNDQRKYCCDKCNYETQQKKRLVCHVLIHDKLNAPKYSCDQCSYQTIYSSHLKTHLRTHNSFGLICILCQKSFKRKDCLDAHYVSRHSDKSDQWESTITSKINQCPKCLYKTVITSNFKDHLATHGTPEDEAQFKCNICEYKCKGQSHFRRHFRLHVGEQPFVCTACDKRFNIKGHLDGHIISRHSDNKELISSVTSKVHHCDKCNYKTVKKGNIEKHVKSCLQLNDLVT